MEHTSGVGVLDKAVLVLDAVEGGAGSLGALTEATGLSRATAHRLAVALEVHRLLARDARRPLAARPAPGRAGRAGAGDVLLERAGPVLARLRDATGESAQLYRRQGDSRVCVAAAERGSGLRDTVPVGSALPMTAGSAAQVLLAWTPDDPLLAGRGLHGRACWPRSAGGAGPTRWPSASRAWPRCRRRSAAGRQRRRGRRASPGPLERLTRSPGRLHADAVVAAAAELSREAG